VELTVGGVNGAPLDQQDKKPEQACPAAVEARPTAVNAIPVCQLTDEYRGKAREALRPTPLSMLRQMPILVHRVGPGDVLGITIEGVLQRLNYPILVQDDATIALPIVLPFKVEGLTLLEVQEAIRQEYLTTKAKIERINVTLLKPRTCHILVLREDGNTDGKKGTGYPIDLPVGENDVLNALVKTGGLPGADAKNEVLIYKKNASKVIRIPLLLNEPLPFNPENVILENGDIVYLEAVEKVETMPKIVDETPEQLTPQEVGDALPAPMPRSRWFGPLWWDEEASDAPPTPLPMPPTDAEQTQMKPSVINLIRVPSEQQVMLSVTVVEVNRTAAGAIGLKFDKEGGVNEGLLLDNGKKAVVFLDNGKKTLARLNVLKELNYARMLAEPKLVCLNTQTASFQSVGTFPVPVVGEDARLPKVQYIQYGTVLKFTPTVADGNRIRLELQANVSTPCNGLGLNFGGAVIPGLTSRNFEATCEIREGQTVAVSGLRDEEAGRILVILVTPELVQPMPIGQPVAAPVCSGTKVCDLPDMLDPPQQDEPIAPQRDAASGAKDDAPMNLADVAALSSSGVSDEITLNQIHTTGACFKLCTEEILFLKRNKVSDRVVIEMQNSRHRLETISSPVSVPVGHWLPVPVYLPEPGSYYPSMPITPVQATAPMPAPMNSYQPMPAMPALQPYEGYPPPYYQPMPAMPTLQQHNVYPQPYYQPVPAPQPYEGYPHPMPPQVWEGRFPYPPPTAPPTMSYEPALDMPVHPYSPYAPLPATPQPGSYFYHMPPPQPPAPPLMPNCPPASGPCPAPNLSFMWMPPFWDDRKLDESPKLPAEFPLKTVRRHVDGEVRVVVLTTCVPGMPPEAAGVDRALAGEVIKLLQERCAENQEKVLVKTAAAMDEFKKINPDWRGMSSADIGTKLDADYIIDIEVLDMSLFEEGTDKEFMHGRAQIAMTVFDLSQKSSDPAFSPPEFSITYPRNASISKLDVSLGTLKQKFIKQVAQMLVVPFTSHSSVPDEAPQANPEPGAECSKQAADCPPLDPTPVPSCYSPFTLWAPSAYDLQPTIWPGLMTAPVSSLAETLEVCPHPSPVIWPLP
jgi:protein involved in polysaccharide export with SLBB domain